MMAKKTKNKQQNNQTEIDIIAVPEGKVRDYIDGTFRKDTPEEYVRQNLEKRLVNEHRYPKTLIRIEHKIKHASSNKRVDIAIFPKDCSSFTQENIKIIVECKNEKIKPKDKKDGVEQLKSYMAACSNCEWGLWTNGTDKEVLRKIQDEKGNYIFEDYIDIPTYNQPISDIDRPKRGSQKKAVDDNLLFTFKKCHNFIYANDGLQKQQAFFELLKVIFCKIEDERNFLDEIEFYSTSKEKNSPDGQITVKKRIERIFSIVKNKYGIIFNANEVIDLSPRSLANIVAELQKYSLLETNIDVKGKAYEEIVGSNLRGDRGEFFTPRNVMKMAVDMISPKPNEKVLDSSCGTGGFLVTAMTYVLNQIEESSEVQFAKPKRDWNNAEQLKVRDMINDIASKNFFGFDINPDLVKASKMNMVMNNDGSGNIYQLNSLLSPHEWPSELKKEMEEKLNLHKGTIKNHKTIGLFDIIVTNPPFGSKIPINDKSILEQYDLSLKLNSVPPEQLFIERCWQLLKPGGRMAIVLPDSILGNPNLVYIRKWIMKHNKIIASVDLDGDTFQPRNGTQTSILILQKKNQEELNLPEYNYNIFMAIVDKIGHDKRGVPVYKRDEDGELLYFPKKKVLPNGETEISEETELDDQTVEVPKAFKKWKRLEGISW
jgi:type I restriction enzyme M protein